MESHAFDVDRYCNLKTSGLTPLWQSARKEFWECMAPERCKLLS